MRRSHVAALAGCLLVAGGAGTASASPAERPAAAPAVLEDLPGPTPRLREPEKRRPGKMPHVLPQEPGPVPIPGLRPPPPGPVPMPQLEETAPLDDLGGRSRPQRPPQQGDLLPEELDASVGKVLR